MSVSSQNELVQAEVDKERHELATNAAAEQVELVGMLRRRGIRAATARLAAAEISAHPDKALAVHAFEELGVNPAELPSPYVAAGASLVSFAVGAIIPLLPYAVGRRRAVAGARPGRARRDRRAAAWWRGSPAGRSGAARCGSWCSARSPRASRT